MNLISLEPNTHREAYRNLRSVQLDLKDLFENLLEKFLDRFVLFRWDWTGYFNKVSANRRMISAAVLSMWLFLLFMGIIFVLAILAVYSSGFLPFSDGNGQEENLFKIDLRVIVSFSVFFLGSWTALYWREKSSMYKKWSYLANLYNEFIKSDISISSNSVILGRESEPNQDVGSRYNKREAILASMCIDILHMRMWSHRSFRTVFKDTLAKAIHCKLGANEESYLKALGDVVDGKLTYGEASKYLSDYQWQQFHKSDFPLEVHQRSA